jgi:hypothetical protein
MTKAEIALELTKLALERAKIYNSDLDINNVANVEKETFNMFIKELNITDAGNTKDSE